MVKQAELERLFGQCGTLFHRKSGDVHHRRMANSIKTESDHDHQDRVGACFGDHRLGQRSCVCQPAPRLAGGKQLPGGFGIRPNLGLGLWLNDESEHLPPHISTENDHEDTCHKISGCTRIGSRARAERRDLIVCTTPRPELYTAIRQFGRADGSLLLSIQLQSQMTCKRAR
jgi:hypothetical protein